MSIELAVIGRKLGLVVVGGSSDGGAGFASEDGAGAEFACAFYGES